MKELQPFALYLVAALTALGIAQSVSSYDLAAIWPLTRNLPVPVRGELTVLSAPDWRIRIIRIQVPPTGFLTPVVGGNFPSPGRVWLLRVSKSGSGDSQ